METMKEVIVKNINQALLFNDYELNKKELILLDKVIEKHYDDIADWKYAFYRGFAELICRENLIYALKQFDLIDQNDLNLPSEVIIKIEDFDVVDDVGAESFIVDYLAEIYDYCVYDFNFEIKKNKKSISVSNIDWGF
ncbi:MAG: hypothetical protein M0Q88_01090 [Bacilli bacterium]|nr:hypothetical protein [Bacilli bacterium]